MVENTATHTHSSQKKLLFSILLTAIIFVAEFIGGISTGSLALLSDSCNNCGQGKASSDTREV